MNIDFEIDNYKFNARVSAIIFNKDKTKVLLFKVDDGRDYYLLPGGRIEFFEDSASAIKREIKEELGFDLNFELCSIQENFVEKNNKKISQFCFCYKAIYDEDIISDSFKCIDNDNQTFTWVNISDISNYKIFPTSTYNLIKNKDKNIIHLIER